MKDKKLSFGWALLANFLLWPFYGALFYMIGKLARAALVG